MAHTQSMPAPVPAQDSISPDSTQIFTPDQPVRRYTVTDGMRNIREADGSSARAPMLRLEGAWLKRAGFTTGTPVTVRVDAGRLVIEVAAPERVAQAEVLAAIARVADGGLPKRDVDELVRRLRQHRAD